ncbi:MAG: HD domain-containing protein [Gammaproteobacteria bacterium]|nr:HD domain-containing protein [Gammaproteobacteria bacterium]
MTLSEVQGLCRAFVADSLPADAAHDLSHVKRVVKNTLELTEIEGANRKVTVPAAWLHDCVAVPKDSPLRAQGSRLAAEAGTDFLRGAGYDEDLLPGIFHAIEAHSFSANIPARSLEARVVQDADRLDSLGAIGVARCLLVGGKLDRPLCDADDPFCDEREADDSLYTLDHFYTKLLKLPDTMQTEAGRTEAHRRAVVMRGYLDQLRDEILG